MRVVAAVAALLALAAAPAVGQGLSGRVSEGPIEVYADDGIEWSQDGQKVIARGNATAVRGEVTVLGDMLTAHYRDRAGESEVYRLDANGNVRITTPTETATGSSATYDIDKAVVVLRGKPKLVTPTDTVTAEDIIEYWEAKNLAVARGNAVATRADRRIRADVLTATFVEGADGNLTLKRSEALGNVVLTTAREVITGDRGDYNAETGIATVTGSVKITRDDNQLNGGYATVNLNTGISKLFASAPGAAGERRVRGLLVPERDGAPGAKR